MTGSEDDRAARAVESTLGRLLPGALHELGNPLVALGGTLELLLADAEAGSKDARRLEVAQRTSEEITGVVRTLQRLARERREPETDIDIGAFARDTADIARRFSLARGVAIEIDVAREPPPIRSQPATLRAALLTAVLDALETAETGSRIDLIVDGACVRLGNAEVWHS